MKSKEEYDKREKKYLHMFAAIISSCSYLHLSFFRVLYFLVNLDIFGKNYDNGKSRSLIIIRFSVLSIVSALNYFILFFVENLTLF